MSTAARKLRVGIVGGGFMGRVHGRSALVAGAQVVGAVGSSPDRAAAAAEATGAEQGFAALDELLAADIDLIHVCTPNNTHLPVTLQALEAGKHVICEKPLATSAKDADRVARGGARGRAGRPRCRSSTATTRWSGSCGPGSRRAMPGRSPACTAATCRTGSPVRTTRTGASTTRPGGPSRAFADIGSHWCDLTEFVTGDRIADVSAQTRTVRAKRGGVEVRTEDLATAQFRTAAGVVGTVVVSQVAAGRKNRLYLEVSGTESSFGFDQEDPDRLWVGRRDASQPADA